MEKSNYNNCSRPSEFGECEVRVDDAHLSESPSKVFDFDEAQAPLALLGNISPHLFSSNPSSNVNFGSIEVFNLSDSRCSVFTLHP